MLKLNFQTKNWQISCQKLQQIPMENINLTTQTMEIIKLNSPIPEDYVVTVKDAGGDDAKDSDPDSDGTVDVTIKG